MSSVATVSEKRLVLDPVNWATYCSLVDGCERSRGLMTYDRGVLEIMSPMLSHESAKSLLGRMVEQFTLTRGIDMRSSASTTFRRSDLRRGFEADQSYYIQHVIEIRGKHEVDLAIDPPPDLVIEIEMTQSSLRKLDLFVAMGIPEVWRYDGQVLSMLALQGNSYREISDSLVLGGFPVTLAQDLLAIRAEVSETKLIRRFVENLG